MEKSYADMYLNELLDTLPVNIRLHKHNGSWEARMPVTNFPYNQQPSESFQDFMIRVLEKSSKKENTNG